MTSTDTNNSTTTSDSPVTPAANAVTWFEIHTANADRAAKFYGSAFGWQFDTESFPGYVMIQLGDGAPIGGGIVQRDDKAPSAALFMVQVPDVAAALAAVRHAGGSVVADAQSTPVGLTFGYAADPDGSVFGIWCPPPAG